MQVLDHIGLLVNEPPGIGRIALYLVIRISRPTLLQRTRY